MFLYPGPLNRFIQHYEAIHGNFEVEKKERHRRDNEGESINIVIHSHGMGLDLLLEPEDWSRVLVSCITKTQLKNWFLVLERIERVWCYCLFNLSLVQGVHGAKYYTGKVRNQPTSSVHGYFRNGSFDGVIHTEDETYYVESSVKWAIYIWYRFGSCFFKKNDRNGPRGSAVQFSK